VLDFVEGQDQFDLSALLPNFQAGDDVGDFVRFEVVPQGTELSINPSGSGNNFQLLATLEGVEVTELSAADLGLGTSLPAEPTVISTSADGAVADGAAFAPSLSQDGRFATFASIATNLVEGDSNAAFDIFRKNLSTGEVELLTQVRVPGQGVQPANGSSFFSAISGDGSVVAFDSAASNLATGETGQRNVFVRTLDSPDVDLVSIVGNRFATQPSLSEDGTLVAFGATATGRAETGDPAPLDTITERVYVRDLSDGSLVEASSDASGNFADRASFDPDISANGNFVAFESMATNLLGEDLNPGTDIYVKSLVDGSVQIASTTTDGLQGFGNATDASISGNGRFVAFQSTARLVIEDFDAVPDIYVKDLQTGELRLVTINSDEIKGNGASFTPSISDDGRFVAFRSAADNLVANDANGQPDIFVADMQTGRFLRIELATDTSGMDPDLVEPTLSGDGALVAFVDQIVVGAGGVEAAQVMVAPVRFGGGRALALADVLSGDDGPIDGPAATAAAPTTAPAVTDAAADAPQSIAPAADLGTLVITPDPA
jgi:Tol biopolymer transport system component